MKIACTIILTLLFSLLSFSQNNNDFNQLNNSKKWKLKFKDSCTNNWKDHWFLDGKRAKIKHTETGMNFTAGPIERDDACHAVLWTNNVFKGDIKIEYQYTRTDTSTAWVNIIYIQATGVKPFKKNIYKWRNKRTIPAMKTYFNYMKTLHISYAAFNKTNEEYIRVRKYPVVPGENFNTTTEITPAIFNTGLFKPFKTYKITIIKTGKSLYFKVENNDESEIYFWNTSDTAPINKGRIGLRHMFTRSATYSNFKVFTK